MDVRCGRRSRNSCAEREVRDIQPLKIAPEPDAFLLVRIESNINAAAMVKAEQTVGRCLATSAYRKRFKKHLLELGRDPAEVEIGEAAGTIELFHDAAHLKRHAIVRIDGFFDACVFGEFVDQLCTKAGQVQSFQPEIKIFLQAAQTGASKYALVHKFLRSLEPVVLAVNQPLSGRYHFVRLLLREVFDPNGAVQVATENHIVLGVGQLRLRLLQASSRNGACGGHAPQPLNF